MFRETFPCINSSKNEQDVLDSQRPPRDFSKWNSFIRSPANVVVSFRGHVRNIDLPIFHGKLGNRDCFTVGCARTNCLFAVVIYFLWGISLLRWTSRASLFIGFCSRPDYHALIWNTMHYTYLLYSTWSSFFSKDTNSLAASLAVFVR